MIAFGVPVGLFILFFAFVIWRRSRPEGPPPELANSEARARRLGARALPVLMVFFAGIAVYDAIDGDWFGVAWLGVCIGVSLIGLRLNRRRLAEIQPKSSA